MRLAWSPWLFCCFFLKSCFAFVFCAKIFWFCVRIRRWTLCNKSNRNIFSYRNQQLPLMFYPLRIAPQNFDVIWLSRHSISVFYQNSTIKMEFSPRAVLIVEIVFLASNELPILHLFILPDKKKHQTTHSHTHTFVLNISIILFFFFLSRFPLYCTSTFKLVLLG